MQILCKYEAYVCKIHLPCTQKGSEVAHKNLEDEDALKERSRTVQAAEELAGLRTWCGSASRVPAVADAQGKTLPGSKDRFWPAGAQGRLPDSPGQRLPSISTLKVDTEGGRLADCPSAPSRHPCLRKCFLSLGD